MTILNPKNFPSAPARIADLEADAWGQAYFVNARKYAPGEPPVMSEDGYVLSSDGAPFSVAEVQVHAGEVFMFTGSEDPAGLAGGLYLKEDDRVSVPFGSVIRFRAATANGINPVVVVERMFNP